MSNILYNLLSDLVRTDDILFIVRTSGAILEMKSNQLSISEKENWIRLGDNEGPAHMHINKNDIRQIRFTQEPKENKTSFRIDFLGAVESKQFSAVFSKMYDEKLNLKADRKRIFDAVFSKYGSAKIINLDASQTE